MRYEIHGKPHQILDVHLHAGESLITETGAIAWMQGDVRVATAVYGGLLTGLKRSLTGDSFFLTTYTCASGTAVLTFTTQTPGNILPTPLVSDEQRICQKNAFLVAEDSVAIDITLRRKLGRLFSNEGFTLQRLSGPGLAWLVSEGSLHTCELHPGETLQVAPAHIIMFEASLAYELTRIGHVRNLLSGGEGLYLMTFTGPGRIWLQSSPLSHLAGTVASYFSKDDKKV